MIETTCSESLKCPKMRLINELARQATLVMPNDSQVIRSVARQEKEILALGCQGPIEVKKPVETKLPSQRFRKLLGMKSTEMSIATSYECSR